MLLSRGTCPLRVKFGSPGAQLGSPLYPQDQTSSAGAYQVRKVPNAGMPQLVSSSLSRRVRKTFGERFSRDERTIFWCTIIGWARVERGVIHAKTNVPDN
jgi:hypothetical protein